MNAPTAKLVQNWEYSVLFAVIAAMLAAASLVRPIPQSETYHHFADVRSFGVVSNALHVLSNAFFLVVGILGMGAVLRDRAPGGPLVFIDPAERWPYFIFFLGVALTTFGSAYYHAAPGDARLVWDRLPITLGVYVLARSDDW